MQTSDTFFVIIIVMLSAVIHEVMHGYMADSLGDPTARYQGRLTLNPLKHLDPFGSVILPMLLVFSGSPIFFGWAKPVQYNPFNLKPWRFSEALVAAAGPLSNLIIAIIFGLIIRLGMFPAGINAMFFLVVVVNVMLCFFNLIPIPPLDGSKVLSALLPRSLAVDYDHWRSRMEFNPFLGMMLVLVIIIVFGGVFDSFVYTVTSLISGM